MNERPDELFDETRLRRALRLEASERPPRLDVAALAVLSGEQDPAARAVGGRAMVAAAVAGGVLLAFAAVGVATQAPALLAVGLDEAIALVARAAVPADGALALAQEPTVPIALLAAVVFAAAYELVQRRERVRVANAS
ncbi:MAG: hypothetical protein E6H88_04210 [Chloroflexi bacterium]|nr:MAG: hypothetical protein E6I20_07640 [Chloroflexota bacterium]TMG38649.1 MAG: hypothetical protein E6H88_04210 [Chloroflexota bacterium]